MKKNLSVLLSLALVLLCLGAVPSCPASAETGQATFIPGTYEGRADSTGGEILVSVTVSEHAIESIDVLKCNDTDGLKNVPMERIPAAICGSQSLNVDGVSGATLTSLFLKNAIKDAVSQATDDLSMLNNRAA